MEPTCTPGGNLDYALALDSAWELGRRMWVVSGREAQPFLEPPQVAKVTICIPNKPQTPTQSRVGVNR